MQEQQTNILSTFAVSQFGEYYLPSVNRAQFEKLDSTTQYDAKFKDDFNKEDTLHIIIGMDSGLLANYVLEMATTKGGRFIFVELDAALSLLQIDIPDDFKNRLHICNLSELAELLQEQTYQLFIFKKRCEIYRSLGVTSSHLEEYTRLSNDVEKIVQNAFFESEVVFSQKIFVKTQFENLIENRRPASVLKDKFTGMSCIIIAGGPSLDQHLDWIKSQSDNLVIIAVSRIASKLKKEGITPHIIVSVDPQDRSFELNCEMMQLHQESLLVQSYHLCPRISAQWQGRSLYLGKQTPWITKIDEDNIESIGPTVTNSAVHLAINMGFSQLLLCGVDFCHSRNGFTHAQGTIESSLGPNLGQICEWVDTYAGEQAETLIQLLYAIEALQSEVEQHPTCTFINLSENAAVVKGIGYQPTENIQLQPIEVEKLKILQVIEETETHNNIEKDIRSKIHFLKIKIESLSEISRLSAKAIELNLEMQQQLNNRELIISLSDEIEGIEQEMREKYHSECHSIKFYGYYEFSQFLTTQTSDSWSQEQLNETTYKYYHAFNNISLQLRELLTLTLERAECRLLEFSPEIDINRLAKQWHKDNQPGRIRIWKKYHPDHLAHCDNASIKQIDELEDEYQQQLNNDRKTYIDSVKKTSTLERTFIKIMLLINTKHHTGLKQIATCLQPLAANSDETNRLYHLSYAHQLQLEERDEDALSCILALDEHLITEPETKLIIQLSLKLMKLELANKALKKAITYSDEYLPRYANVLRFQGFTQESVNTYLDYLEKYPSDLMVWLKFGSFMFDLGEMMAAVDAFNHVIESDPDNQVALNYLAKIKANLEQS